MNFLPLRSVPVNYNQNYMGLDLPAKDYELYGQKPLKIYWKKIYLFCSKNNINYQTKFTLTLPIQSLLFYSWNEICNLGKHTFEEISFTAHHGNVPLGNCLFKELSFGELSAGEMSIKEMSLGNCPSRKCPLRNCTETLATWCYVHI